MQDIWHHIHSLMPLCDAARVACLSRAFLRSWRCYPNLTFNEYVFSPEAPIYGCGLCNIIDCIMRNHSGIGVKILKLQSFHTSFRNLNRWLRVAVKPGIGLGTQFGTLIFSVVPSAPQLNLAPYEA
jgi:hypothetical protein